MKICLFTNTFLPHVGGVARSVQTFMEDFRRDRHRVLVVAPEFAEGKAPGRVECSVERVPAIQNFNGSDFSVRLPLGTVLSDRLSHFRADVIHAHHPFLLGDTALRIGAQRGVPVVFTHHTLYEQYTHYVPFDSPRLKEFVVDLSTRFANRCQAVIAPSESIAQLIRDRGVTVPVEVIPTGVDTSVLGAGDRRAVRQQLRLHPGAVLLGHVGRLAPEKNLLHLAESVARVLEREPLAHFMIVGDGPTRTDMERFFRERGVSGRTHFTGKLTGRRLIDAYAAMDLFLFTSQSETQGMVLLEAMAAGNPVIALDATGVREVVRDRRNGRLLPANSSPEAMARVIAHAIETPRLRVAWKGGALATAQAFDRRAMAGRAIELYRNVRTEYRQIVPVEESESRWNLLLDRIALEARLVADKIGAAASALAGEPRALSTPAVAH